MDKTLFAKVSAEKRKETLASDALRRALKPLDKENKLGPRPSDAIKVVDKRPKPLPVTELDTEFDNEPIKTEGILDPFMSGLYEFFDFNPWDGHGPRKQKIKEIAEFVRTEFKADTRGKAIQALTRLVGKMAGRDMYESKVDQVYKYIRIKAAARDLSREAQAYESGNSI